MRSFLAFFAVARLTSADESCTEAADEATLLQGRLFARGREANENQFAAAVPNEGTQCWHGNQCGGQGGQCPSGYCGEGVCCRYNWTPRNAAEEEYCGDGYGNGGMHQCHPNRLTYRNVSQLPHTWQSAERSFGVEVPLDSPRRVHSVTVHSDWWMKRPDLVAVYATDQDGATHKLTEFEYGGSLDICSGGHGACSYPDDGTGSATSQRTVDINSDIVATAVRVQVVTPLNANGQPNGQVIIKDVSVPAHYLTVTSWPEWAWGAWDEAAKGPIEKCLPGDQNGDPDGSGHTFTSCCTADGVGMSRECGTTRHTDFATATAQCEDQGGRLCTADEALDIDEDRGRRMTATQGCQVDGPREATGADLNRLWTATPC